MPLKKSPKKIENKQKAFNKDRLLELIDDLIEHRLFKPVVIAIITSFFLLKGFEFLQNLAVDYKESLVKKRQTTPIKIKISEDSINFDIHEVQKTEYRIKSGDTLLKILIDTGASESDIFSILTATKKIFNPRYIMEGNRVVVKYKVKINYDQKDDYATNILREVSINSVEIFPSVERKIVIARNKEKIYQAKEVEVELTRYVSRHLGIIKSGLFVDGIASGLSPNAVMNMINLYSYDVDFQRDIRTNNKFEVLVETFYSEEGKKVKDGDILFASLTTGGREIDMYMHKVKGENQYFNPKGYSVRKSLLRTPINGARVSSRFGMRRHPVLGYSKMHKGVDFAAPRGTPILAAGSGIIQRYGRNGGYGNYVKIKHNSEYSTAYAHASRLSKKFRKGSRVKQGDVIAYVGTTGRSTGPHLHFEVVRRGRQINPSKVKATSGLRLKGKELKAFKEVKAKIDEARKNTPNQNKS